MQLFALICHDNLVSLFQSLDNMYLVWLYFLCRDLSQIGAATTLRRQIGKKETRVRNCISCIAKTANAHIGSLHTASNESDLRRRSRDAREERSRQHHGHQERYAIVRRLEIVSHKPSICRDSQSSHQRLFGGQRSHQVRVGESNNNNNNKTNINNLVTCVLDNSLRLRKRPSSHNYFAK
jgi:hypothetical protein